MTTDDQQAQLFPDLQVNPVKTARNIREMHALYGKTTGKLCRACAHFRRKRMGNTYFKCRLAKNTNGSATDWRARWEACGRFVEIAA